MTNQAPTIALHGLGGAVIANLIPTISRTRVTNQFTGETSEHEILRAVDGPYRYEWDLTSSPITTNEIAMPGGMWCSGMLAAIEAVRSSPATRP